MTTIPVSIDAQGNITCPDVTVNRGDTVTWAVTWATAQGSISVAPVPGKNSPFTSISAPGRGNSQWSAVVGSAGDYNLSDTAGKIKTPKITIISPVPKKQAAL